MGKVCKACGVEKDFALFTKDPRNNDGLGAKCQICFNARQRQLYPNRPIKRRGEQYDYHRRYNKEWIRTLPGWIAESYHGCKARRDCSITKKDILALWERQKGICALTGQPMDYTASKRAHNRPSIDRIDNTKGYHQDNVRLVWHLANLAKNVFTDEQLIRFCEHIIEHNKRRAPNAQLECPVAVAGE